MRRILPATGVATIALLALTACVMSPPGAATEERDAAPTDAAAPSAEAEGVHMPANMASYGIRFTADGVTMTDAAGRAPVQHERGDAAEVIVYLDPMCPWCGRFEDVNGDDIDDLVENGVATLEIRPVAFLDRYSEGSEYSTRAVNAIVAVADEFPTKVLDFVEELYDNQPRENTSGLSNDELIALAAEAGASSEQLSERINTVHFRGFVEMLTSAATSVPPVAGAEPITSIPTVFINGVKFEGDFTQEGVLESAIQSSR